MQSEKGFGQYKTILSRYLHTLFGIGLTVQTKSLSGLGFGFGFSLLVSWACNDGEHSCNQRKVPDSVGQFSVGIYIIWDRANSLEKISGSGIYTFRAWLMGSFTYLDCIL